ncbi:hypothetical protein [Cupriavidus sp. 8B]
MHGIPKVLHLDNAAEFEGRALRSGCNQHGVELMYRPAGRPYFGGHIARLNRTIMERVHSLPGSTGSSPKARKERKPEAEAALTIRDFEQWLMQEIGQTYHHASHRGLQGATPYSMWAQLAGAAPPPSFSQITRRRIAVPDSISANEAKDHPGRRIDGLLSSLLASDLCTLASSEAKGHRQVPSGGLVADLRQRGWQALHGGDLCRPSTQQSRDVGAT